MWWSLPTPSNSFITSLLLCLAAQLKLSGTFFLPFLSHPPLGKGRMWRHRLFTMWNITLAFLCASCLESPWFSFSNGNIAGEKTLVSYHGGWRGSDSVGWERDPGPKCSSYRLSDRSSLFSALASSLTGTLNSGVFQGLLLKAVSPLKSPHLTFSGTEFELSPLN